MTSQKQSPPCVGRWTDQFRAETWNRNLKELRRAWGKRPYRTITVNQCDVLASSGMVNTLLKLGNEVNGFCGLTGATPRKRFTAPVSAGDPRLRPGGWFGAKAPTKAGKVWSK